MLHRGLALKLRLGLSSCSIIGEQIAHREHRALARVGIMAGGQPLLPMRQDSFQVPLHHGRRLAQAGANDPGSAQNAYMRCGDYYLMEALDRELHQGETWW